MFLFPFVFSVYQAPLEMNTALQESSFPSGEQYFLLDWNPIDKREIKNLRQISLPCKCILPCRILTSKEFSMMIHLYVILQIVCPSRWTIWELITLKDGEKCPSYLRGKLLESCLQMRQKRF